MITLLKIIFFCLAAAAEGALTDNCPEVLDKLPTVCSCISRHLNCTNANDDDLKALALVFQDKKTYFEGFTLLKCSLSSFPVGLLNNIDATNLYLIESEVFRLRPQGVPNDQSFFDGFTSLRGLAIRRVSIADAAGWPYFFAKKHKNLSYVELDGNELGLMVLWPGFASDLAEKIRSIIISNTQLAVVDADSMSSPFLGSIDLSRNGIIDIAAGAFRGCVLVTKIDLARNLLTTLPEGIFDDLILLRSLYLDNNQLKSITRATISPLTNLATFYIAGNVLQCDCSLRWMLNFIAKSLGNCLTEEAETIYFENYFKNFCNSSLY